MWENFLISERIKYLNYTNSWTNSWTNYWFWRTKEQKELDFIEEVDGHITTYEFKWNPDAKVKFPKLFKENYPNSDFEVIHRDNFEIFIL